MGSCSLESSGKEKSPVHRESEPGIFLLRATCKTRWRGQACEADCVSRAKRRYIEHSSSGALELGEDFGGEGLLHVAFLFNWSAARDLDLQLDISFFNDELCVAGACI